MPSRLSWTLGTVLGGTLLLVVVLLKLVAWWIPIAVLGGVLAAALVAGWLWLFRRGPRVDPALWQPLPEAEKVKAIQDFRALLIQMATGVAALGALVFTALGLVYTAQTLRQGQETVRLTEQGQITDRYTKAVDQLGSDKLDVRIGGIYALERIMWDSPRDHETIIEVLTTFIREHARPPATPTPTKVTSATTEGRPSEDVQAALTVLERRDRRQERNLLNLRKANLSGANFSEVNLQGVDLFEANLQGADFREANLQGTYLSGANLQDANLRFAKLQGVELVKANLRGTDLREADLRKADLDSANLQSKNLFGVNFQDANLNSANLQGMNLFGVNLQDAYLEGTNLQDANLFGANLQGADLRVANLRGADLSGVWGLTREQLTEVYTDNKTRLPPDLQLPTPATSPPGASPAS